MTSSEERPARSARRAFFRDARTSRFRSKPSFCSLQPKTTPQIGDYSPHGSRLCQDTGGPCFHPLDRVPMRPTGWAFLLFVVCGVASSPVAAVPHGAEAVPSLCDGCRAAGSIVILAGWGDGYGEAEGNSGGGYGGGQDGSDSGEGTGSYGEKPPSGGDTGYPPKKKSDDYGGDDQPNNKPSGNDTDEQPSTGSGNSGGGNFPATQAVCLGTCQKKCMNDFVPGSSSQKSCSGRCARQCRPH